LVTPQSLIIIILFPKEKILLFKYSLRFG
jgi:hypothetical protein